MMAIKTSSKMNGGDTSCSRLLLFTLCLAAPVASAAEGEQRGFLRARDGLLSTKKVVEELNSALEDALAEALGHGHGVDEGRMEARRERIRPMFESMPKNMRGAVNREALQYMVHRYFGAVHGWSIQGFVSNDLAKAKNKTTTTGGVPRGTASILQEKLPFYVEAVLESRLERDGFTMQDVVVMVTVLERMIMDESVEMLEGAFYLNEFENHAAMDEEKLQSLMESFMMVFALRSQRGNRTKHNLVRRYLKRARGKDGWASGVFGASHTKAVVEEIRRRNPFREHKYSFETAMDVVHRTTESYGQWTNGEECQALKETLVSLDREGSGRLRLPDFYAGKSAGTTWHFDESVEYLRAQGALDESSPKKGPRILIPNYVQSMANCVAVSGFYSICCMKECEEVMAMIERAVREPRAAPARLLPLVQGLIDAHEEDPRNLTSQLVAQLEEVAQHHQGKVPIHGRLFQQWLHYVFPYECPYPHKREVVEEKSSQEWVKVTGQSNRLTKAEIQQFVEMKERLDAADAEAKNASKNASSTQEETDMSSWNSEEELYVGHHHQGPRAERRGLRGSSEDSGFFAGVFRGLMRCGVLVAGLVSLWLMVSKALNPPSVSDLLAKPAEVTVPLGGGGVRDVFV